MHKTKGKKFSNNSFLGSPKRLSLPFFRNNFFIIFDFKSPFLLFLSHIYVFFSNKVVSYRYGFTFVLFFIFFFISTCRNMFYRRLVIMGSCVVND